MNGRGEVGIIAHTVNCIFHPSVRVCLIMVVKYSGDRSSQLYNYCNVMWPQYYLCFASSNREYRHVGPILLLLWFIRPPELHFILARPISQPDVTGGGVASCLPPDATRMRRHGSGVNMSCPTTGPRVTDFFICRSESY